MVTFSARAPRLCARWIFAAKLFAHLCAACATRCGVAAAAHLLRPIFSTSCVKHHPRKNRRQADVASSGIARLGTSKATMLNELVGYREEGGLWPLTRQRRSALLARRQQTHSSLARRAAIGRRQTGDMAALAGCIAAAAASRRNRCALIFVACARSSHSRRGIGAQERGSSGGIAGISGAGGNAQLVASRRRCDIAGCCCKTSGAASLKN